jgi:hypothetical protein
MPCTITVPGTGHPPAPTGTLPSTVTAWPGLTGFGVTVPPAAHAGAALAIANGKATMDANHIFGNDLMRAITA